MIRPTRSLPDRISALTGLTTGELDWAKNFSEVVPDFIKFIGDLPIVAHNADFDMGFLREKLPRIKHEIPTNAIWDNLKLGVLMYPELHSYALDALAEIFGVPVEKSHRASEDCIVTGILFNEFLKKAPAVFDKDLLKKIVYEYLEGNDLAQPLKHILEHPDYDKYAKSGLANEKVPATKLELKSDFKKIKFDAKVDFLIRVNPDDEKSPEGILQNRNLYPDKINHNFTFPSTQFPGDYWGVGKKWNQLFDSVDGIELYPGKKRLLCRRQMRLFVEEDIQDRLSLTGYEIAVLSSFASSSKMGNFSRLSWWIWNNLTNLSVAIPLLNASNCEPEGCAYLKDCYYLKAVENAKSSEKVGFPFRVLKEEHNIPNGESTRKPSDLTFLNPEGIFRDNLGAGITAFELIHSILLIKKIIKFLPESETEEPLRMLEKAGSSVEIINSLVDSIISRARNLRLQKGKRFFLFIQDDLVEESAGFINELRNLILNTRNFIDCLPENLPESIVIIRRMIISFCGEMEDSLDSFKKDDVVLCLDKIENSSADTCRFLFFPHIFHTEFLEIPSDVQRIIYLTHHLSNSEDWESYIRLLGRDKHDLEYCDVSDKIPSGNQIYLAPPKSVETQLSKKKLMGIKGDIISQIMERFPGRTLVIVRGSQELLNFKYRLAPKLKRSGFWPLFQKQDGPKGLLIKEFSKHQNVVFFGLTDLVGDIMQFKIPPDNLIFESLHLTSLQDPIESFIKKEIEDVGADYMSEYLEPRVHFTLTRCLKRWQNYLEGRGRIFILDEKLATSESGMAFIDQLDGVKSDLTE